MILDGARVPGDLAAVIGEVRIHMPLVAQSHCVISSQWGSPDRSETLSSGFRQGLLNERRCDRIPNTLPFVAKRFRCSFIVIRPSTG